MSSRKRIAKIDKKITKDIEHLEQNYKRQPRFPGYEGDGISNPSHNYGYDSGWTGDWLFIGLEGSAVNETDSVKISTDSFTRKTGWWNENPMGIYEVHVWHGYLYLVDEWHIPGQIIKLTYNFQPIATLVLSVNDYIWSSFRSENYLYLGHGDRPPTIVKVDLDSFTEYASLTLNDGDGDTAMSLHSPDGEYLYVGHLYAWDYTEPWTTSIVKISMAGQMSRVAKLDFPVADRQVGHHVKCITSDDSYLYVLTQPSPGRRIGRIRLSDFTYIDYLLLESDETWNNDVLIYKDYMYIANTAGCIRIKLSTFSRIDRIDSLSDYQGIERIGDYLYLIDYTGGPGDVGAIDKIQISTWSKLATLELLANVDYYALCICSG